MKDDEPQQEDVAGLFRKFGGDVAAYKEFAPAEIPALARPAVAPSTVPPAAAVASLPSKATTPSALELLFARLDGQPAVPAPVDTRGLMAHWRKPI